MTKPMNIEAIEKATGKSWDEWLAFFKDIKAKELAHHEIAEKVFETGTPDWWAQNVTVAYEQHIGRRAPGQRRDGTYEVSVTKTISGTMDDAFKWWLVKVAEVKEFSGVLFAGEPKTSNTDKWRHWRVNLSDGSKVIVSTSQKTSDKALLAVTSQKLASAEDAERWRVYWKQFIANS
jgi:hypothetical protein